MMLRAAIPACLALGAGALGAQPNRPTSAMRGPRRESAVVAARRDVAPSRPNVIRQPDVDSEPSSCPHGARLLRFPAIAVVGLAAPVAGIAALISDHPLRAASGAMIGGAGYAAGVTLWLATRRECHAGQAFAYVATPVPAIAGAWVGSR